MEKSGLSRQMKGSKTVRKGRSRSWSNKGRGTETGVGRGDERVGALADCPVILGQKEGPVDDLERRGRNRDVVG